MQSIEKKNTDDDGKWRDIPVYRIREGKNNKVIIKKSIVFGLLFESNLTTGYSWNLIEDYNKELIRFLGITDHEIEENSVPLLGGPGYEKFVLESMKTGQTKLRFNYSRPWEKKEKPDKTVDVLISITGEK